MDIHRLKEGRVQEKLRSALGEIIIREGISLKDMSEQMKVSAPAVSLFLRRDPKYIVGIKILLKIAHFLTIRGYDLEKIVAQGGDLI